MGFSHINDYAVGEMPPRLNAFKIKLNPKHETAWFQTHSKVFFHPRREWTSSTPRIDAVPPGEKINQILLPLSPINPTFQHHTTTLYFPNSQAPSKVFTLPAHKAKEVRRMGR
jgi:hypothetical protein